MESKKLQTKKISEISFKTQIIFFVALLLGIVADLLFPLDIFPTVPFFWLGIVFLFAGPLLSAWAQSSSATFRLCKKEDITAEDFCMGPYKYTRHPTYLGIILLLLGFAFIINAFFVALSILLSAVFAYTVVRKEEEKILEDCYGDAYREYEKKVRLPL